jgi:MFS family permease
MAEASPNKGLIRGVPSVVLITASQAFSVLTTEMSQFAIRVWVFERTGTVTALGLVYFFYIVPFLAFSPIAGVMIDRYNRKVMMAMSDLGAISSTLLLLLLSSFNMLDVWHLYVAAVIGGIFGCFQWPAYSASISLMVPKDQLIRVNGLLSTLDIGPGVIAPLFAGVLLPLLGLNGLLLLDVATFVIALLVLLLIYVPQPQHTPLAASTHGSWLSEAAFGFRYIFSNKSLLGLQLTFLIANFLGAIGNALRSPMVLTRTFNDPLQLGWVSSAGSLGAIVGGMLVVAWPGPKRRIHAVLFGHVLLGLVGGLAMGLGTATWAWAGAQFCAFLLLPYINGASQSIWQSKVPPEIQGRVFSARRLIAWSAGPAAVLITGALTDQWLEPAMRNSGALSQVFGTIFGSGPGSGMALLYALSGLGVTAVGGLMYLNRHLRNAEDLLPDNPPQPPMP